MGAGYFLVDVEWTDEEGRDRYVAQIGDVVAKYGGEFVARSPDCQTLEGDWRLNGRLVLLRFPTFARGLEWYRSDEYAPLLEIRQGAARTKILYFEGA